MTFDKKIGQNKHLKNIVGQNVRLDEIRMLGKMIVRQNELLIKKPDKMIVWQNELWMKQTWAKQMLDETTLIKMNVGPKRVDKVLFNEMSKLKTLQLLSFDYSAPNES